MNPAVRDLLPELMALLTDTAERAEKNDLPAIAATLADLREIRRELTAAEQDIEAMVVAAMGSEWQAEIPGVGVLVRHSGKTRKGWDHDRLWSDVARAVRECPKACPMRRGEGGEILGDAEHLAAHVRACAGISYWKRGGMAPIGLDIGDYSTYSEGRATVEIK